MDMEKQAPRQNNQGVLLFVNGPYQFIVGLACVRKYVPDASSLEVIGYDMRWQKALSSTTADFAAHMKVNYRTLPFEFKKSDPDYKRTYPLRSLWNMVYIKDLVKNHPAAHIFAPKLFNNPERAIAEGAQKKALYIFDDGIGLYLGRIITFEKNKYVTRFKLKGRPPIVDICPSVPSLFDMPLPSWFRVNRHDYTQEVKTIIAQLADGVDIAITEDNLEKDTGILCFSRISLLQSLERTDDILKMIDELNRCSRNLHFLIKPHPRDDPKAVQLYFRQFTRRENCELLEPALWMAPVEILAKKIAPKVIVSGASTIAVNQQFFPRTKLLITGIVGEQRADLSAKAIQFLENIDGYTGDSVDDLIQRLKDELCPSSIRSKEKQS